MKREKQQIRKDTIRDLYQKGYTIKDISEIYDLSRQYVWGVIHRKYEKDDVKDLTGNPKGDILVADDKYGELEKQK